MKFEGNGDMDKNSEAIWMFFYLFLDLACTVHGMDSELSGKDQERILSQLESLMAQPPPATLPGYNPVSLFLM